MDILGRGMGTLSPLRDRIPLREYHIFGGSKVRCKRERKQSTEKV